MPDEVINSMPVFSRRSTIQCHVPQNNKPLGTLKLDSYEKEFDNFQGLFKQQGHYLARDRFIKSLEDQEVEDKQVTLLRDYISKNGHPVRDTLSSLLKSHRFVIVGETHLGNLSFDNLIGQALPALQQEAKSRGEELIIAIEFDQDLQKLITTMPIKELRDRIALGHRKGMVANDLEMIIAAKEAGVQIIAVDSNIEENKEDPLMYLRQLIERDEIIFQNVRRIRTNNPNARIMYYGGSLHGSRRAIRTVIGDWTTLAQFLIREYGPDQVITMASVNGITGFERNAAESKLPSVVSVLRGLNNKIVAVPVGGPIPNGDMTHDYVITDPASK